jgi:PAS domain-containing protein
MIGLEGIAPQMLSDTIGAIYDCALAPDRWQDAVHRIVELSESQGCGVCVHDMKNFQNDRLFESGYDPEFSRLHAQNMADSPFVAAASLANVGDVATLALTCSDHELRESRFYREVMQPFGYIDLIGLIGLKTAGRIANLHAGRTERASRYGERDIGIFRLLSPHICRTLTISDALDIRTLRSEMLEATLDGLAAGVYLTRRDGRVVYMNATAERQVKRAVLSAS